MSGQLKVLARVVAMDLRGMSEGWGMVAWLLVGWLVGAVRAYRPGEEYIPVNRWEGGSRGSYHSSQVLHICSP